MKCKQRFIRLFAAITLCIAAVSFSTTAINDTVPHNKSQKNSFSELTSETSAPLSHTTFGVTEISQTASHPLAFLFQILFFLFLISPPIIALMLCLIWKELKERNKMK
ncbi:hypothetical protein BH20ACI1_BH20ACI1_01190 [soil metagenome]